MRNRIVGKLAVASGLSAFVLGLCAGSAEEAQAYWERISASACQPLNPNSAHSYYIQDAHNYLQNTATTSASFVCPIPDSTNMPKSSITTLQVRVNNNSAGFNITGRACAFNAVTGGGGNCGSPVNRGPGAHTMNLPTTALQDANETPYIWISLPPINAGSASDIKYLYFGS
jgi:hypothetical protein